VKDQWRCALCYTGHCYVSLQWDCGSKPSTSIAATMTVSALTRALTLVCLFFSINAVMYRFSWIGLSLDRPFIDCVCVQFARESSIWPSARVSSTAQQNTASATSTKLHHYECVAAAVGDGLPAGVPDTTSCRLATASCLALLRHALLPVLAPPPHHCHA